ncbi:MAG: class I SAM-dependent methyltransferase [Pseudomonadales bacterium]
MNTDADLYESPEIWDQSIARGQQNLLSALHAFWPANVRDVLDVGCGDGKITHEIARLTGAAITGLDSSAEALSRLKLRAVLGDAARLPFPDGTFDLVMSTDTLEHLNESVHVAAWQEMFRVARDYVVVAVPFREELLEATARCTACQKTYHVNWHQRSYDLPDFPGRARNGWALAAMVLSGGPGRRCSGKRSSTGAPC